MEGILRARIAFAQAMIFSFVGAGMTGRAVGMRLTELDYNLPPELIAQEPLERRDEARLMVLDRRGGTIEHSRFYKLGDFLRDGDLLGAQRHAGVPGPPVRAQADRWCDRTADGASGR